MDFTLTADQLSLATAVDGLASQFKDKPIDFRGFALVSPELDQQLAAAEFFDIAATPGLGPVAAALTVERMARLPFAAEVALSMLLRPHLGSGQLPRPFAFVERGRPARFLAGAKTALIADAGKLSIAQLGAADTEPVQSIYAYPMGRLTRTVAGTQLSAAEANDARKWLRIALAAEAAGLMQAAIDSTVEHLTVRKQFGRPLGSFQALRHRMAECAVLAGGLKLLTLKAASTGNEGDAALAAFHAQESGARLAYDLHQFLGAMGMTLEHSLHLWTYRLKLLLSELGGQSAQAQAVVQHCFS